MGLTDEERGLRGCRLAVEGAGKGQGIKGDWWPIDVHSADHQEDFILSSEYRGALGRF